jgi:hypothetical protein
MGRKDEHPGRPWAAWTAEAIDRHDRGLLASFAERAVLDVDGLGPTLFCRGSPLDDGELLTALTPERRWRPALEGVAEEVVVCRHTHGQFDRQLGSWRVINAGSVGLPYEGRAGAYWCCSGPTSSIGAPTMMSTAPSRDVRGRQPRHRAAATRIADRPQGPREVAELFERQADAH